MKFLVLFALVLFAGPASAADTCRVPGGQPLKIACTVDCPAAVQKRLNSAAEKSRFEVEFVRFNSADALSVDALISPGGKDIHPRFYESAVPEERRPHLLADYNKYGKRTRASALRDEREVAFFKQYFSDSKFEQLPVLGICYGMQMLAVSAGLPLIVDIPHELGIPARYSLDDSIQAHPQSRIAALLGSTLFLGHEEHHQAVDIRSLTNPASFFKITATSNQGRIPEVIEFSNRPAMGLQFHPEQSAQSTSDAVFGWLLEQACVKRRASAR